MDTGAWWATVHGVTKSRTRLSDFTSLGLKTETSRNKTATTRKLTKRWVVAHFLQEVIPGLPT